jgi:hypothetical protein
MFNEDRLLFTEDLNSLTKGFLMNQENPVIAFSRDFSGDDAAIMTRVKSWVADPPTDDKTIGVVNPGSYRPRTRLFLATVNLLTDKGKIYVVEDTFIHEIFWWWRDEGAVDPATLPSAAKAVFGPWMGEDIPGAASKAADLRR